MTTIRKPSKAKQSIIETTEYINRRLKSAIPQSEKVTLCVVLEQLLMTANMYAGFNNNYWLEQGYKEWREAGQPEGPDKKKFIVGPCATEDPEFISTIKGEYSRTYWCKK